MSDEFRRAVLEGRGQKVSPRPTHLVDEATGSKESAQQKKTLPLLNLVNGRLVEVDDDEVDGPEVEGPAKGIKARTSYFEKGRNVVVLDHDDEDDVVMKKSTRAKIGTIYRENGKIVLVFDKYDDVKMDKPSPQIQTETSLQQSRLIDLEDDVTGPGLEGPFKKRKISQEVSQNVGIYDNGCDNVDEEEIIEPFVDGEFGVEDETETACEKEVLSEITQYLPPQIEASPREVGGGLTSADDQIIEGLAELEYKNDFAIAELEYITDLSIAPLAPIVAALNNMYPVAVILLVVGFYRVLLQNGEQLDQLGYYNIPKGDLAAPVFHIFNWPPLYSWSTLFSSLELQSPSISWIQRLFPDFLNHFAHDVYCKKREHPDYTKPGTERMFFWKTDPLAHIHAWFLRTLIAHSKSTIIIGHGSVAEHFMYQAFKVVHGSTFQFNGIERTFYSLPHPSALSQFHANDLIDRATRTLEQLQNRHGIAVNMEVLFGCRPKDLLPAPTPLSRLVDSIDLSQTKMDGSYADTPLIPYTPVYDNVSINAEAVRPSGPASENPDRAQREKAMRLITRQLPAAIDRLGEKTKAHAQMFQIPWRVDVQTPEQIRQNGGTKQLPKPNTATNWQATVTSQRSGENSLTRQDNEFLGSRQELFGSLYAMEASELQQVREKVANSPDIRLRLPVEGQKEKRLGSNELTRERNKKQAAKKGANQRRRDCKAIGEEEVPEGSTIPGTSVFPIRDLH